MKKFVTLFEKTENFHLIKDVGQIPYLMHHYFGYDATIVTYKNNNLYPYLDNEVKGLKLKFIPKVKLGRYSLSALVYLFLNAKNIDVLHLFHHREKTYLNFLMYKWRNPDGIAFLKSDMGLNSIKEYDGFVPKKRPKYAVRQWLFDKVLAKLDVLTIETQEGYEYVCNRYPDYADKMFFMPNGMNIERMYALAPVKTFADKENIILTVGRIGAPEKNNEMLLSAIEKLNLGEWKVVFIGPIEKRFESVIEEFFQKNPHLQEKVIFTGAIYDRQLLFEWYARSKIFCLTSIEESFGFVLIEAMAYGNYVVTTSISSANEITDCGQCGTIVSRESELSEQLRVLIEGSSQVEGIAELAKERTFSRYDWKTILRTLNNFIEKKQRL
jgi:glycosyltransferase involved in cell wall biosynthesis